MISSHMLRRDGERGVTLIDAVIGSALMLVVLVGIGAAFRLSLSVVTNNKSRAGAIALMNERMEYLRSLSYTQIGVIGGIPAGNVPQIETTSSNGVTYTRRTSVYYADDPQDGTGAADQNGIIADYKAIRVEVSWSSRQGERSVSLVGRVSPAGVESAVAGGVLTIAVVNAAAVAVADAQIDIINTGTSPAINIRTFTNAQGIVSFIGAPAASNYQITVSRPGHSSAQTYPVSPQNPDPNPRHLTVANNQTTSATFEIDLVSTKTVETYMQVVPVDWNDTFNTLGSISATSNVDVLGGEVMLAGSAPFASPGSVRSVSIAPPLLAGWNSLSWAEATSSQTSIRYRVSNSSNVLVPDSILPGNASGFTSFPVDLSGLSTSTYPAIRLEAELTTTNPNATPSLQSWTVSYDYGPEPKPNLTFSMRGGKTIGNNPTVYKYQQTHNSGATASLTLPNIEEDTYTLSIATTSGYKLAESCAPQPEILSPGSAQTTRLYVLPYTQNTLLVDVRSTTGALLSNASARLYKAGFDQTLSTALCGQVFFESLATGTYTISVSKAGYQTYENAAVNISSDISQTSIVLSPL